MSNVDTQELAKFSDLAHKWWDPDSEFRPLHEINPLRLDWIERCAGPLVGRSVVDIGCGGGILWNTARWRRKRWPISGLPASMWSPAWR